MAEHRFKIGQAVVFRPKSKTLKMPIPLDWRFRIVQLLPALNGFARYRIRNELDGRGEHIAIENELRPSEAI